MARRWFEDAVPPAGAAAQADHPLAVAALAAGDSVNTALTDLDFRRAAEAALQLAIAANGYLNDQAPWKQMKLEGQESLVAADLYAVLEATRWVAVLLAPLLPELSDRMLVQLGQEPFVSGPLAPACAPGSQASPWLLAQQWGQLEPGRALIEPQPVMLRLELDSPL